MGLYFLLYFSIFVVPIQHKLSNILRSLQPYKIGRRQEGPLGDEQIHACDHHDGGAAIPIVQIPGKEVVESERGALVCVISVIMSVYVTEIERSLLV